MTSVDFGAGRRGTPDRGHALTTVVSMSSARPLPPGVYWRRRVFVLGVAFALVFVIARWLTGSSDASDDDAPVAEQAGAQVPTATRTVTAGEQATDATATGTASKGATAKPTLAQPDGPCEASDIVVTPSVAKGAEAGGDVTLTLSLQTLESEACTWEVSRSTVTTKISDGSREVWTTQQCPRAVPTQSVVVRRSVATLVELTWNAKESAANCSRRTDWVMPGDYTIEAAALGGEPGSAEFSLVAPATRTVVVTPKATPKATSTKKPRKPVN